MMEYEKRIEVEEQENKLGLRIIKTLWKRENFFIETLVKVDFVTNKSVKEVKNVFPLRRWTFFYILKSTSFLGVVMDTFLYFWDTLILKIQTPLIIIKVIYLMKFQGY